MSLPDTLSCALCSGSNAQSNRLLFRFEKPGANNEPYRLYRCASCGALQVAPLPKPEDLKRLYQSEYFKQRTDRGYRDYAGKEVELSFVNTMEKNLRDLNFFFWEQTLKQEISNLPRLSRLPRLPRLLEVGCAAGHFLKYMTSRQWDVLGVDISQSMVAIAQERGLPALCADFLLLQPDWNAETEEERHGHDNNLLNRKNTVESSSIGGTKPRKVKPFDLVVMWATIEHLNDPQSWFDQASRLLRPGGRFILSTAHYGFWAKVYGRRWRYLNLPEHLFFFTRKSLRQMADHSGLKLKRSFTYGSGFTSRKNGGALFQSAKKIADNSARHAHLGDMIVAEMVKPH